MTRYPTFLILEVYRPPQRGGVILVGTAGSARITVRTRLALNADRTVEVVAVDLPTSNASADRLALVVRPDLGECLVAGVELTVERG